MGFRSGETLLEYVPAHQGEESRKGNEDKINTRNPEINMGGEQPNNLTMLISKPICKQEKEHLD